MIVKEYKRTLEIVWHCGGLFLFWLRFYIVVLEITFFSSANLHFPIFIWTFILFFYWTCISLFYLDFSPLFSFFFTSFSSLFHLFFISFLISFYSIAVTFWISSKLFFHFVAESRSKVKAYINKEKWKKLKVYVVYDVRTKVYVCYAHQLVCPRFWSYH